MISARECNVQAVALLPEAPGRTYADALALQYASLDNSTRTSLGPIHTHTQTKKTFSPHKVHLVY